MASATASGSFKAQVLGAECLGRRALLYNMPPMGMTVTAVRIARFECVRCSARALVRAMCACVRVRELVV